jgi:type II secretory pathway pseudopilin PulG
MRSSFRHPRPASGFTLVELIVALGVMTIVIVGIALLFDFNTKLARAQTNIAEMQQSLRVAQQTMVREVRMAGRGGVPVGVGLPAGVAVAVRDNVGVGGVSRDLAPGLEDSPQVVEGTDVLTVRGVFNSPLYQINDTDASSFTLDTANPSAVHGTLKVMSVSHTGVAQSTQALIDSVGSAGVNGFPEALILVSPLADSIFAIVELDPDDSDVSDPTNLSIAFKVTGGTFTDQYTALYQSATGSAVFPTNLTSVAFAGILEEYRYYIREEHAVPGDDTTELRPRLSRARMYPGTEIPYTEIPYHGDLTNTKVDVADDVVDLQVALGIDTDNDGTVVDLGNNTDEWLYNSTGTPDDATDLKWNQAGRRLYYLRISTLARTDRREHNYVAPAITAIEDRVYGEAAEPADEPQRLARMFHRRLLQTVVEMRNLS